MIAKLKPNPRRRWISIYVWHTIIIVLDVYKKKKRNTLYIINKRGFYTIIEIT